MFSISGMVHLRSKALLRTILKICSDSVRLVHCHPKGKDVPFAH